MVKSPPALCIETSVSQGWRFRIELRRDDQRTTLVASHFILPDAKDDKKKFAVSAEDFDRAMRMASAGYWVDFSVDGHPSPRSDNDNPIS